MPAWLAGSDCGLLTKAPVPLPPQGVQADNVLAVLSRLRKRVQTAGVGRQAGGNPACEVVLEAGQIQANALAETKPHASSVALNRCR